MQEIAVQPFCVFFLLFGAHKNVGYVVGSQKSPDLFFVRRGVDRFHITALDIEIRSIIPPQPLVHIPPEDGRQAGRGGDPFKGGIAVAVGFQYDRMPFDIGLQPAYPAGILRQGSSSL